jgi:hypothetical protein
MMSILFSKNFQAVTAETTSLPTFNDSLIVTDSAGSFRGTVQCSVHDHFSRILGRRQAALPPQGIT